MRAFDRPASGAARAAALLLRAIALGTVMPGPITWAPGLAGLGGAALAADDPALVAAYAFQEGRGSTAADSAGAAG